MDYTENIVSVKNYINTHLFEELSADKIAAYQGYSTFHFCRIFKEYTGKSLMRYVREKRLEAAEAEMQQGKSTYVAALDCGFETASGFSRAYKKLFGERPGERLRA